MNFQIIISIEAKDIKDAMNFINNNLKPNVVFRFVDNKINIVGEFLE